MKTKRTLKGEIYKDRAGEYRARVKSPNGNIIASTESYTRKASAKHALELLGISKNNIKDLTE